MGTSPILSHLLLDQGGQGLGGRPLAPLQSIL